MARLEEYPTPAEGPVSPILAPPDNEEAVYEGVPSVFQVFPAVGVFHPEPEPLPTDNLEGVPIIDAAPLFDMEE
jgi:hypothetical protein